MKGGRGTGAISAAYVLAVSGSRNKLMDKHRTALPAITRDAVTGEHRAIAVDDERNDAVPETGKGGGAGPVTAGPDLASKHPKRGVAGNVDVQRRFPWFAG